ncbi:MAG: N-6 DNA methylase [Pyrinomonadaceae bacterium]
MENTVQQQPSTENLKSAISEIKSLVAGKCFPNNKKLIEICRQNTIELIGGNNDSHLIHELLETAINLHLSESFKQSSLQDEKEKLRIFKLLSEMTAAMPPQSWRSKEQTIYQQFSTPAEIAFLMVQMLRPGENELALEPSAGTGNLAVWLKLAGCRTIVNEISDRRRKLLEIQGYAPHKINAEFLNDLLPPEIEPDCILINPPFSSSAGRIIKNDVKFGFRHLRAALDRLEENGRLVALLGASANFDTIQGRKFWSEIADDYEVVCLVKIPGKAFYKMGTTVETMICYLRKTGATKGQNFCEKLKNIRQIELKELKKGLEFVSQLPTAI